MIKAMLALWSGQESEPARFQHDLTEAWAPSAAEGAGVLGLAVSLADLGSGERWDLGGGAGPMADAVVSLWLDDAALGELRKGLASGGLGPLPPLAGAERVRGWVVEEHRPKRYERDWPDGAPSPGVKLLTLMRPPDGRSLEECARYWLEQHTPLALRVHVGLWNYVQNVVREPLAGSDADVFGIVELHFRSRESLRAERYDSEAGRQAVREDIPRFMAMDRTQGGYFSELIVRSPPQGATGPQA